MKRKAHSGNLKKLISIFLACIMILSLPLSALATEELPEEILSFEEIDPIEEDTEILTEDVTADI